MRIVLASVTRTTIATMMMTITATMRDSAPSSGVYL
jgi:hypothetical protein